VDRVDDTVHGGMAGHYNVSGKPCQRVCHTFSVGAPSFLHSLLFNLSVYVRSTSLVVMYLTFNNIFVEQVGVHAIYSILKKYYNISYRVNYTLYRKGVNGRF
jgi:hypothetical protein